MADPTSTPPVEPGQEPVEPTEPTEPTATPPVEPGQEPVEPPTLPEPTPTEPPPPMTPEQQRDHDMKSWIGRRDAELLQKVESNNAALLEQIGQIVPQPGVVPATPTPKAPPDPTEDANAWFKFMLQEEVKGAETFNETVVKTGTAILQQDELVKTDPTLGKEIYEEISSGRVPINKTLTPEVAAGVAVATAKANILSKRLLIPVNPLGDNTPTTEPLGGVAPPAAPSAPAVDLPNMSDLAKETAKRMGLSDEQTAKILKE